MITENDLYPVTIICDRYNGCYSGGKYTAWNEDYYSLSEDADGSDIPAMNFFYNCPYVYGVGNTPNEALEDLKKKLAEKQQHM